MQAVLQRNACRLEVRTQLVWQRRGNVQCVLHSCQHYSRRRSLCKAYTSSDDEEYQQHANPQQLVQSQALPGPPAVSSHRGPWKTGGIVLGIAALLLALVAWYTSLRRQGNPRRDADQHAVHREAPASEADLDNTVRTLTEQRLSDTPTNLMMQGVSIRQPAESCWRPSGVGHVTCSTKVTFQQSKRRKAQTISGPAAVELLRLQLQYLIFLKQSDTISSLNQKPKTYLKL